MSPGRARGPIVIDTDVYGAAVALRLGLPLVSDDGIFHGVPGLRLETLTRPR